jgi:putative ABC transport system substrate-binding protein
MMDRRAFLGTLAGGLLAAPLAAGAQQAGQVRRIGFLSFDAAGSETAQQQQRLLRESLRRVGFDEGANLVIEWRFADGSRERLSPLATELVHLNVELILAAASNEAIAAARQATRTIPIVMHLANLPVESGFVESLAHPGGNVTGTTWLSPETNNKQFQILKEAVPGATRVTILGDQTRPEGPIYRTWNERAAGVLGLTLQFVDVSRPEDVMPALRRVAAGRPDVLYVATYPVIRSRLREIIDFTLERKLPSMGAGFIFVRSGGLLYYGPDIPDTWDRTVSYVDRILRGARAMDLAVEEPTKYRLVINLKTAKALGLTIPQSLLQRADQVIE